MKGGKLLFLVMNVILLLIFLEIISSVFSITGDLFIFEFVVFIFLLIMGLDSMIQLSKGNKSSVSVLSVLFSVVLLNEIGLNMFAKFNLNISLLIISALGFIITIFNYSNKEEHEIKKDIDQPVMEEIEPIEQDVVEEYYPGKFLASKTGKKYHIPKCDFAKKIYEKRQIWFNEKKEATKKGYKPCKCIKN